MAVATDDLNRWASQYMGETGEDVEHAVDARWWTGSPATAFAVLMKVVNGGTSLEMDVKDRRITIELGEEPNEVMIEGSTRNMGRLMIEAAYLSVNGEGDDS